jgi:pimeloyl-ACP methyl ester carboxylesterase
VHGAIRNEDGTYSWKFDSYLNVWSVGDISYADQELLWQAITCPVLMFYGTDSFASNPQRDGRMQNFSTAQVIEYQNAGHWLHHDQFERFVSDLRAFL